MIQKFICVPKSDYDVIVVSNGTIQQVETGLAKLNGCTNNEILVNSNITYLDTFEQLVGHLENVNSQSPSRAFRGKVIFMFFNGVSYIQDFLSSLIDHYNKCLFYDSIQYQSFSSYSYNSKSRDVNPIFETIENAYFYVDSSTVMDEHKVTDPLDMYATFEDTPTFNSLVSITNDILKKMSFMLVRVRGLYIDDATLTGEKAYPLRCLVRNFPNVERIELASRPNHLMTSTI